MTYTTTKEWIFAFDTAALDVLAGRADVHDASKYRMEAKPCPKHGPSCVSVVYGDMVDHFAWSQTDPAALARKLLESMLPPAPSSEKKPE